MSSNIYLYQLEEPEINNVTYRDGAIDVDSLSCSWYEEEDATPEWVLEHGVFAELVQNRIDLFAAGEELFGQRPSSISLSSFDLDTYRFYFPDGTDEEIMRADLMPFYHDVFFSGYLVEKKELGSFDSYRIPILQDADNKVLSYDDIESILCDYMDDNESELEDDYGSNYYHYPLYILVKSLFAARSAIIICELS